MPKKTTSYIMYNADDVWAASCAAQRINNGYLKKDVFSDDSAVGPKRMDNRSLMHFVMEHKLQTKEDYEQATLLREYMQGLLLKQLTGKINEFEKSSLRYANQEEFSSKDYLSFAFIACLPSSYERAMKRDQEQEDMAYLSESSMHIGQVGDKVLLEIKVLKSVFSRNYMTNFITAVTDQNLVFFAYKNALEKNKQYKISGTVKAHRDNNQTQLNRVRIK